ncbi:acyltransferase family protein [Lyngbya confervoides]|uniref:Acyltransferase n=1 Tax=Lyngbya confervoides BDU141951 TaxID=1574623 RepID=A0ABD4T846_9CYAN|nr:acyltransferase [Lyngbya confervoides]MCM1984903.1 acyltransferase [Lyngbya confervoides BDU141951]
MSEKNRLTGIDLLRGLAIYAVIVLHSDEPLTLSPYGWNSILEFSKFAVPFFLAASFYLSFLKFYTAQKPFQLRVRAMRLLIPYGIWSGVYLGYKGLKYLLDGEADKIATIVQDPVGIIFCGGAAFHLYFLPLLMMGTVLVKLIYLLPRRDISIYLLVGLFIVSLAGYQALLASGNEFNNAQGAAFLTMLDNISPALRNNILLRLLLVALAWTIRCLPYILLAMVWTHPKVQSRRLGFQKWQVSVAFFIFITVNLGGIYILPGSMYELGRGYTGLMLALMISQILQGNVWIQDLGVCSFGIYLSHLFFVESFYIVINRVYPAFLSSASSFTLLICSGLILLVCWWFTNLVKQKKLAAPFLLGT